MKFNRIEKGWYATEDGRWAVVNDGYGYVSEAERNGNGPLCGITGNQWAAVFDPKGGLRQGRQEGENLEWFYTKREAIAFCIDVANSRGLVK